MYTENYNEEQTIGSWWLSIIVGVVALMAGFITLVSPAISYIAIAMWLGVAILVSGIMGLIQSIASKNTHVRRGWIIVSWVLDIIIGILLMLNPMMSGLLMPIMLGAWLLYRGIVMIMQGSNLRREGVRDAGWVIFYGVVIIAIAIAVLWMPLVVGIEAVIIFLAIAFITYGVSTISLGFRLWDLHRRARTLRGER